MNVGKSFFCAVFMILFCVAPTRADVLTPFTGGMAPRQPGASATNEAPRRQSGPVRAGVVPHHGLASETIAHFYDNLPRDTERVILLGPDHFKAGRSSVALCPLSWRAGKGILEVDSDASEALVRTGGATAESLPFRLEHSIGLHVAFIGRYFPDAKIVTLIVKNTASPHELSKLVPVLSELLTEKGTLLLLSMDFSHGKTPGEANREDDKSVAALLSLRTGTLQELDIDAPRTAWLFLEVLKTRGIKNGTVLERTNSGEIVGRPDLLCTSYATLLFR